MVNITETFTKLYGRKPTQSEVATMWQMKREQEAYRKEKVTEALQAAPEAQEQEIPVPKRLAGGWPHKASQIAQRINRMLHIQMTVKDIAFVEGASEHYIMSEIEKWTLPRQNTDVYKKVQKA